MPRFPTRRTRVTSQQTKTEVPEQVDLLDDEAPNFQPPTTQMGKPATVPVAPTASTKEDIVIGYDEFKQMYEELDLTWRISRNPQVNGRMEVLLVKMKKMLKIP